ncbi:MAG: HesA/MoeB/ThiF family protein [Candidatus Aenigmatarchaeota archaeon]
MSIYDRQVKLFGEEKQKELEDSLVLVVGCGGLGSNVANLLARAGADLRLADGDVVEESNLHRTLYRRKDVGRNKAVAMKELLEESCSTEIQAVPQSLDSDTVEEYLKDVDVVADCLDNMETRYLLNRSCVENGITLVHGSVVGYEGRSMTFLPDEGPCFRCLYPERPSSNVLKNCREKGVSNSAVSFIASFQVAEVVKYLTGEGTTNQRLLKVNLKENEVRYVQVNKRGDCEVCSSG